MNTELGLGGGRGELLRLSRQTRRVLSLEERLPCPLRRRGPGAPGRPDLPEEPACDMPDTGEASSQAGNTHPHPPQLVPELTGGSF